MTMFGSQWFANPGVTYEIDQSIRFDKTTSSHLSITFGSAGDRKTWTFSTWFKRGKIDGTRQSLLAAAGQAYLQLGPDAASREMITLNNEGSGTDLNWYTTQVFRDPAAWYHLIWRNDTTQSDADNRVRLYVNGVQVTDFTKVATPAQDFEGAINNAVAHNIGELHIANYYYDGLQSEINFVDGLSLGPTSFGKVNNDGVWIPIEYTGAYGGNGFYLTGATSSDLGEDFSGNDNDFSSSGLAADDQMTDSPTNNVSTLNPLGMTPSMVLSDGNLVATPGSTNWRFVGSTISIPPTGKWVFEAVRTAGPTNGTGGAYIGIGDAAAASGVDVGTGEWYFVNVATGNIEKRTGGSSSTVQSGSGDLGSSVIRVEYNADDDEIQFFDDGSSMYAAATAGLSPQSDNLFFVLGPYASNSVAITATFNEDNFVGTPTSDFKGLSTSNFSDPTIADPSAYFQPTIYTGDGASSLAVNQGGNSTFDPDLVWIKNRDATDAHCLFDSVRGATKYISSDDTTAETTDADTLLSFDSDGFSVGADVKVNTNTEKYVGWQWLESTTSDFDIVSYTGTGSARTVSHNLGVKPDLMLFKRLDGTQNWRVYHHVITANNSLFLDLSNAQSDDTAPFNDTEPTSSVFTVGTDGTVNANTQTYIAYHFAGVESFNKFGSYTGNNDANGPFVWCGFRPAFVLIKATTAESWWIGDDKRPGYNDGNPPMLAPDTTAAEDAGWSGSAPFDILSNGFKIRRTGDAFNGSGGTYLFAAFAETPFKTATAR